MTFDQAVEVAKHLGIAQAITILLVYLHFCATVRNPVIRALGTLHAVGKVMGVTPELQAQGEAQASSEVPSIGLPVAIPLPVIAALVTKVDPPAK